MPTTIRFRRDGVPMHMHPVHGSANPEGRWHQPFERHPSDPHAHIREDAEHPYILRHNSSIAWERRTQYSLSEEQENRYFAALRNGVGREREQNRRGRGRVVAMPTNVIAELSTAFDQRRFGVEIECIMNRPAFVEKARAKGIIVEEQSYNHHDNEQGIWKIITDGSLRYSGRRPGFTTQELVSPILQGNNGFRQLKLVCEALNETNALVNVSCGLHVHHDASREMTLEATQRLMRNYHNAQAAIDKLVSPSRRGGATYCQRINASDLAYVDGATHMSGISTGTRYKVVNLAAYHVHKSYEFRQHQGSTEYDKIAAWVKFGQVMMAAGMADLAVPATNDLDTLFSGINMPEDLATFFKNRAVKLAEPANA